MKELRLLTKTNGLMKGTGAKRKGSHFPFALAESSNTKAAPLDGIAFSSSLKYELRVKEIGNGGFKGGKKIEREQRGYK